MQKTFLQKKPVKEKTIFWLFSQPSISKREEHGEQKKGKEALK